MGERCEGRFFVDTCLLTSMKHIIYDWYLLAPVTCQWCFLFAFAENTSSKLVQKPKAFSPVGAWFHRPQPWGNQWETVGLTLTISILAATSRIFLWLRVSSSKTKSGSLGKSLMFSQVWPYHRVVDCFLIPENRAVWISWVCLPQGLCTKNRKWWCGWKRMAYESLPSSGLPIRSMNVISANIWMFQALWCRRSRLQARSRFTVD